MLCALTSFMIVEPTMFCHLFSGMFFPPLLMTNANSVGSLGNISFAATSRHYMFMSQGRAACDPVRFWPKRLPFAVVELGLRVVLFRPALPQLLDPVWSP